MAQQNQMVPGIGAIGNELLKVLGPAFASFFLTKLLGGQSGFDKGVQRHTQNVMGARGNAANFLGGPGMEAVGRPQNVLFDLDPSKGVSNIAQLFNNIDFGTKRQLDLSKNILDRTKGGPEGAAMAAAQASQQRTADQDSAMAGDLEGIMATIWDIIAANKNSGGSSSGGTGSY